MPAPAARCCGNRVSSICKSSVRLTLVVWVGILAVGIATASATAGSAGDDPLRDQPGMQLIGPGQFGVAAGH